MEENNIQANESDINITELALKAWKERKFIIKVCCIAAVAAVIIALSIPRKYTTTIISVPEMQDADKLAGNLASVVGIDIKSGNESLTPIVYPEIIQSVPFLVNLFDFRVVSKNGDIDTTYFAYLHDFQKKAWWSYIILAPKAGVKWFIDLFKEEEEEISSNSLTSNIYQLTKEQTKIAEIIKKNILLNVNTKEGLLSLSVTTQDPLISAHLADYVMTQLQEKIIHYRTEKVRNDETFYYDMYQSSQQEYYQAQQTYADFVDRHQGVVFAGFKTEQDRLQNEMQLKYNLYNQMAQRWKLAQIKLQEEKPVFSIIQPSYVPSKGKPSRVVITFVIVFLSGCGAVAWVLGKERLYNFFRTAKKEEEE